MTHRRTSLKNFTNAQHLRRNPTDAESKLWQILRMHQLANVHFRRQHAIGAYVVDFCAPRRRLVIELDGGQHQEQQGYDVRRTAFLASKGYRVLRFWNDEVLKNPEGVYLKILEILEGTPS
jgi:very-short-patch-repair endonuclease